MIRIQGCKVLDIDTFMNALEDSWVVDKWWSTVEKISLGIEDQKKVVSANKLPKLIEDIVTNLNKLKRRANKISSTLPVGINYSTLKIQDIFDLSIKTNSSQFTKKFINDNKGDVPVYSASKFPESVDYGYVKDNLKNIKYFEDCLTWNIDGSIGKAHYRKGRFSLSEKVIPLIISDDYKEELDIEYLKHAIEREFNKHSFNFGNKAGKGRIKNIEIPIPLNSEGEFDLAIQREIAAKNKEINSIKVSIQFERDSISETSIEI